MRKMRGAEYSQVRCTAPHKLNRRKVTKNTGDRVPPILDPPDLHNVIQRVVPYSKVIKEYSIDKIIEYSIEEYRKYR